MLVLGKKIDYALIGLAWMARHEERSVSAREIAQANDLPLPALMQILKTLHQHGVLTSTRGVKGGYQIGVDLENLSLHEISRMLTTGDAENQGSGDAGPQYLRPLQAMRMKLSNFLRDVTVAEVIRPGRRVDVPLQDVRIVERLTV